MRSMQSDSDGAERDRVHGLHAAIEARIEEREVTSALGSPRGNESLRNARLIGPLHRGEPDAVDPSSVNAATAVTHSQPASDVGILPRSA
jgi:hypothetical protein